MSDESPNERAWREWQETQDHRYPLNARAAFNAGTKHGIEFANWQLEDEQVLAAENAQLRYDLEKMTASRNEYYECYVAQRAKVMRLTDQPSVQPNEGRT